MMRALQLLEKRGLFLQKLAYKLLTQENFKFAALDNLAGDPTIFDKDLSSVLTILFTHNNLKSQSLPSLAQPITILELLFSELEARGFKLPTFRRRYDWIKNKTNNTFVNSSPSFTGGEAKALDKPLRRLHEYFYEIRLHDDGHARDNLNKVVTQRTGKELLSSLEQLVSSVKRLETEGTSYHVGEDDSRASQQRSELLNKRYDEVAALINNSVGTSGHGPIITIYHLHGESVDSDRMYAVSKEDYVPLVKAVLAVRPEWDASKETKFESVSNLIVGKPEFQVRILFQGDEIDDLPKWQKLLKNLRIKTGDTVTYTLDGNKAILKSPKESWLTASIEALKRVVPLEEGLIRGGKSADQLKQEQDLLEEVSQTDSNGNSIVQLVRLPFRPDEIDDGFPSVEVHEDEYIGSHISKLSLELIRRSRFSGFVDFDDKYRMMILWANAPSDEKTDQMGQTFKEHLKDLLGDHKAAFAAATGQTPEVVSIKTGAAYYFPQPISVARLIKGRGALEAAINEVNSDLDAMEQHTRIERSFNKTIDDDELPTPFDEVD